MRDLRDLSARCGLALLIWVSAMPKLASAQSCESLPTDSSMPTAYQYQFRANSARCEGLYTKTVTGGEGMTLVSLTIGAVSYDLKADKAIDIVLTKTPVAATQIQAVGVPLRLYYRLDAQLASSQTALRVPLQDVIAPRQIEAAQFGVYAVRRLGNGRPGYVPVRVGAPRPSTTPIIAIVRPGSDVTNVAWRLYQGTRATSWVPAPDGAGLVPQGQRVVIALGASLPAEESTFEVSFYLDGLPRTDRFVLLSR